MLSLIRTTFIFILSAVVILACDDSDSPADPLIGKSGSLARFAITATHLYSVDEKALNVFQIMENGALEKVNVRTIDSGVETVHAQGQWLYIGTNEAMAIYDISNPAVPIHVSAYYHFVACDPVVVKDTIAYVTMRSNNCRDFGSNILELINIKRPENPVIVSSYFLDSPYGLAIDNNLLFVCEGNNGLKIFDVSDPSSVVLLQTYRDVIAYDAIARDGNLIVTGSNGVVQYDYSNEKAIQLRSNIPVNP